MEDPAEIAAGEQSLDGDGSRMSGGPASEEESQEAEAVELEPEQIRQVQAAEAAAAQANGAANQAAAAASQITPSHLWLAEDAEIFDSYSAILGDAFHFMDRPKVSVDS
jgi:hypothetical protein